MDQCSIAFLELGGVHILQNIWLSPDITGLSIISCTSNRFLVRNKKVWWQENIFHPVVDTTVCPGSSDLYFLDIQYDCLDCVGREESSPTQSLYVMTASFQCTGWIHFTTSVFLLLTTYFSSDRQHNHFLWQKRIRLSAKILDTFDILKLYILWSATIVSVPYST